MAGMDDFIEECLREHNAKRSLHNAPALRHSRALDKTAQDWAEQLISEEQIKNSSLSGRGEVGESISMRTSTASHVDIQGTEVVNQWYADMKNYNFESEKGPAGNFTQLVWSATREVGFGKARAPGKCIVVAHYRPPGNVRGHYAENVHPPTGGLPSGGGHSPTGSVQQAPGTRKTVVTENVTDPDGSKYTVRREVVESVGPDGRVKRVTSESFAEASDTITTESSTGPEAGGLVTGNSKKDLESFGEAVTQVHNTHRARHGAPALKYDPQLSELAQKWAEELVQMPRLSNSGYTFEGIRLGENVLSRWSTAAVHFGAQDLVDHWYQECSKYKFDTEPSSIQGIGGFTQVVWSGSQRIGVGRAMQPKSGPGGSTSGPGYKMVAVCFYYPPGNVTGQFKTNVKPSSR
ncbi:Golgi-associated plant pathogenesis protein 1 [Fasciola gigantica]|uniref:Golgi-associated plant pathogenesis protein 1 n=1 Tax=Fasciola gigantica TaxID=46835 RepID=A0A504Z204_FASGI|nr:Golgi-associated plant pathogenesis protein 1 [Fasciola gigantica]